MKHLYGLFEKDNEEFCSFIKSHVPEEYTEFSGERKNWAIFFLKLYSVCLKKHTENNIIKEIMINIKKEYEHELKQSSEQRESDISFFVEKKYIDIEFAKEKSSLKKTIKFGNYPFYEDGSLEPILWYVLSENNDKMLLVSCQALETMPFNENNDSNDFTTSSLSKWLKGYFYDTAFNKEEKQQVDVMPFILDEEQTNKYFSEDKARLLTPTPHAAKKGAPIFKNGSTWWWLATPGSMENCAAYVNYNGKIKKYGEFVFIGSIAVRPAIVINKKHDSL